MRQQGAMADTVSIIIPAFNAAAFIEAALRTARQQDYPSTEIIVVNDGSTDATLSVVERCAGEDSRIRVITTENRGAGAARATGLAAATGRYVAFLDVDDIWHPGKIRRQLEVLNEKAAQDPAYAAVYTLHRKIDAQDRVLSSGADNGIDGACFNRHLLARPVGNGSSLLVVREVALTANTFRPCEGIERLCEDFEFELSLAARCKIACVSEYLVGYRQHATNLSKDAAGMIQALRRVISRNTDRADPRVVNWVLAETCLAEARCQVHEGHLARAAIALISYGLRDPRALVAEIGAVWRKRRSPAPPPANTFNNLPPSEDRVLPARLMTSRLHELASREHLALPFSSPQES